MERQKFKKVNQWKKHPHYPESFSQSFEAGKISSRFEAQLFHLCVCECVC